MYPITLTCLFCCWSIRISSVTISFAAFVFEHCLCRSESRTNLVNEMSNRFSEYAVKSSSSNEPSKRGDNYNRSWTKQRNFDIDAQNRRLRSKIVAVKSRCPEMSLGQRPVERSNWAINQERRAEEIMRENHLISTRIKNAKSTIKK